MTFLWVFLYGLKTPISILCGIGVFAAFLNFLSARASGKGEANLHGTITLSLGIATFWALVYALPAPTYNQKIVYKDRVVQVPVVKKYIAQKQIVTRTITQKYTQDSRFDWCTGQYGDYAVNHKDECMAFAKAYMQPRIVVQKVNVPVYSGVRTVEDSRDQRVHWCFSQQGTNMDQCLQYAFKMEAGPQVQVRYQHDPYQQLFDKCNNSFTIPTSETNGTQVRNDRIKICGELALQASHDH